MKNYFLGQELQDIIGESDTIPPTDAEAAKGGRSKLERPCLVISITNEDEFLRHIKKTKTPKEAWDTLETILHRRMM